MNFIKLSLKNRQVTLTILAMVFAVGVYSLFNMPRREDPKITVPLGLVVAYYPGASAAQVEEQITNRIEQYLFQFSEVRKDKTYSTTRDGISVVNVCLNDDIKQPDIFWNKLRHQLMIAKSLDLPDGVVGPIVNSDFGDTEAMLIALQSDKANYKQIDEYCKILENKLRQIPASSKIKRLGEQSEQITIYFNSQLLAQHQISLQQIAQTLQSENELSPTGQMQNNQLTVALHTSGKYNKITDIENQIIATSDKGAVVRIRDIATVKRELKEKTTDLTVNGNKAMIVSVQMLAGNNIVKFGDQVNNILEELKTQLPSDVKITTIVNQPQMVDANVSHFLNEFLMAIVSVIIVLLLLLPFNIAAIAATAIPVTIAFTFALLNVFHIELHQVSLAALIVVLGMIVDDAIVVADNYLALLERGLKRSEAAWRSASDLLIPILGATITIIASFMPLALLTGAIGEFIQDLPYTVTIAFVASFIVAMVFTPILCYLFVKKVKRIKVDNANADSKPKKRNLLDKMQGGYNSLIHWFVKHRIITVSFSLATIILAAIIFKTAVGQKFFPSAERNQFVVELWMPTGTKLEVTKEVISRVENEIKNDSRLTSYATFTGTSAPRVYYNFAPEFPVANYAQILINTDSNKSTEAFAHELSETVGTLVPEGRVQVKLMQQGQPMVAPIEVRVFGDDISKLKEISGQIQAIIKSKKGYDFVHDDFREDFYGISINLKNEAYRLGFNTASISQTVYAGFKGYTISQMHEGDKTIDIVLKSNESNRETVEDIENYYLESPITGGYVPLRQVSDILPKWQPGRIMHRNGVRCLTVRSESTDEVLPSELLAEIQPDIAKLELPSGYSIEYGGEYSNKNEVIAPLMIALLISLIGIFLILLVQFKNLKEAFIIMLTIPLSMFGAVLGLSVTGNNFGLTAFMGIISLSGIVVRNAIILIDHANELIENGMSIREAAIESGKRRLRPIFLTAMAAAIGVVPMIISGSSLWSPLASVIAFGVTWSMLMALITVPVLYIIMMKPKDKIFELEEEVKSFQVQ